MIPTAKLNCQRQLPVAAERRREQVPSLEVIQNQEMPSGTACQLVSASYQGCLCYIAGWKASELAAGARSVRKWADHGPRPVCMGLVHCTRPTREDANSWMVGSSGKVPALPWLWWPLRPRPGHIR